ncbi:MAG: molybdopterin biosynthesis protein, partial [Clostridiales bacterium]|nr:molybdopterin biosynthesis protein [Clostridiales bacterium]
MERNIYLKSTDLEEVEKKYFNCFENIERKTEKIKVIDSLNRIASEPIFAKVSSPHYNASAMDGIVVRAKDTYEADETHPVRLTYEKDFLYIDTGDVIPEEFDSVIMIEEVVKTDDKTVEIFKAAYPWQDVRPVGEDIAVLEMIIPAHVNIRPVDIGAMLAGGVVEVDVIKKLRIGIIPTGTEIVDPGKELKPGDIIESNSRVIESLVIERGLIPNRYDIVEDDFGMLKAAVRKATDENDVVIINAGSSAGSEDYTSKVVDHFGKVYFHGINIRPGKPAVLGVIDNKPVIGVPGFPVSAYLIYELIVDKLFDQYYHTQSKDKVVKAQLSRRVMSSIKSEEFVRVKLGKVNNTLIASPLNRGAGVTMSLVRADGVLRIPKSIEGIDGGTEVEVILMSPRANVDETIVSIGSHDIVLDIITNILNNKYNGLYFSSSHQGSFAGVMAMKKGNAHISPVHLLDEKTGVYNVPVIEKYLGKGKYSLVKGLNRVQGFYVGKGNPKNITGIEDLIREDIIFVNRQKGSGTRVLFDYLLKNNNIDREKIAGYPREMNTHMTVAAAVLSGSADVAMGI